MSFLSEYISKENANVRRARLTLRVAVVGTILLLVWAGFAQIDQVTRATGQVIASDRTNVIQSADGGVLLALHVKEGELVKKNQLLATFEKSRASAAYEDSRAKVAALQITVARLHAEVYGKTLNFPDNLIREYGDYVSNQRDLYQKRQKAINDDINALTNMRALAKEELQMNEKLEATGDVSRAEVIRLRRQIADVEAQIAGKRNKYFQDSQAELTKAQEDLNTQLEQFNDRQQLLEHTELRAPSDGIVKHILTTTPGAVVRQGETVMEIVPTGSDLIVEVKVSPMDIAHVQAGQKAVVKFDAYDYSIFGTMAGEVIYVSPDTLTEERQATPNPNVPSTYYRVQIRIGEQEFKRGRKIEIRPGLTANVDIKVKKRSVLSYLTKPVTKVMKESMGER